MMMMMKMETNLHCLHLSILSFSSTHHHPFASSSSSSAAAAVDVPFFSMQLPGKLLLLNAKKHCWTLNTDAAAATSRLDFRRRKNNARVTCQAADAGNPNGTNQMLVYVPPHPLIKHWVSVLRNEFSPPPIFSYMCHRRKTTFTCEEGAMAELGRLLIYEASRDWLGTISGEVQTPCGVANVEFIDPREPVKVVPILRAGLVLVEHVSSILPATQTYHLGFARDEATLQPTLYLNKLPERFPDGSLILVADPMLATGGTIVAAIEELKNRGAEVKNLRVVCAVAAPPALKSLSENFPGLRVYTGTIDEKLNEKGYIVPGLGDAGDRSFGT